ncbi:restriction endonuclease [Microbispora rosea]
MSSSTHAPWQLYEEQIKSLLAGFNDGKVTRNVTRRGLFSTRQRQIDVLAEGVLVGRSITVVVECKHYRKKRVGIDIVESFMGKLLDLGVGRGIMYAYAGFTRDAYLRVNGASNPEVSLEVFSAPAVGLVGLGEPEAYDRLPVEADADYGASYSPLPDVFSPRSEPFSPSPSLGGYTEDDYRHFLLTGRFPSYRV